MRSLHTALRPRSWYIAWISAALGSLAAAQDAINTDRPGLTTSPALVPPGRFQVEFGLPNVVLTRGDGVDSAAWSAPLLLRYGISSALELRLGSSTYSILRDEAANATTKGFSDIELAAKVPLCEADGLLPQASLIGGVVFPVGDKDLSSREAGYDINLAMQWNLNERDSVSVLAAVVRTPVGDDDSVVGNFALGYGRAFDSQWTGFVEVGYFPGFHAAEDQEFAGAGVTYLIDNDLQLDLSGDFGLNADSPDAILGVGISWRR